MKAFSVNSEQFYRSNKNDYLAKVPQNVIASGAKQSHHQEPIEIIRLLRLFVPRNDRPLHFLPDHQEYERRKSIVNDLTADKLAIREVVENWAVWRDAGDWERFATVWHSDGWMTATWFQGPAQKFIEVSREGFNKGVNILHSLGGWTCEIVGNRAISQTKMTISQRAPLEGILVDVLCTGRFYDFLEKRDGRWGIVRRQPIYEKDRMDPVDPAAVVRLDAELLARFPEGYRHLGYLQSKNGFKVKSGLPGLRGPAVEKLYTEGKAWLAGSTRPGEPV
jgi:hypothetical protein